MRSYLENWIVIASLAIAIVGSFAAPCMAKGEKVTFDDHIKPILVRRCSTCHNGDRTEADLDVTSFITLMQGGGSGEVIDPFSADDSYLVSLVTHEDSPEMPPGGNKIPDPEIELLKKWVDQGALEKSGSVAKRKKPKVDLTTVAESANQRPEKPPLPPRLSLEPQIHTARKSQIRSIATNPWSPLVAIALPKQVLLYDTKTFELKGVVPFEFGNPEHLRFSRNGGLLLMAGGVGGASGKVVIWDVAKGAVVTTIGDELDSVLAADISANHKLVALGGPKKIVRVFTVADGNELYQISSHTQWITAIEFSPNGKTLATADRNGGLIVSDAATGNENLNLAGHKQSVSSISWRSDGKVIASVSEDKTAKLWSAENGKAFKSWNAHGKGATSVAFASDGRLLTTGRDNKVKRWKQDGKGDGEFTGMADVGMAVAWCGETKRIIAGDWRGEVLVWKPGQAEKIADLDANPPMIADRIAKFSIPLTTAKDELKTAENALAVENRKLDLLKQESAAKVSEMADATENVAVMAGELAAVAQRIGELADEMAPLRKARETKLALVQAAEKIVDHWQNEAEFAHSKSTKD